MYSRDLAIILRVDYSSTLILGYKGHKESAQLVLTLILLDILTSFDP